MDKENILCEDILMSIDILSKMVKNSIANLQYDMELQKDRINTSDNRKITAWRGRVITHLKQVHGLIHVIALNGMEKHKDITRQTPLEILIEVVVVQLSATQDVKIIYDGKSPSDSYIYCRPMVVMNLLKSILTNIIHYCKPSSMHITQLSKRGEFLISMEGCSKSDKNEILAYKDHIQNLLEKNQMSMLITEDALNISFYSATAIPNQMANSITES